MSQTIMLKDVAVTEDANHTRRTDIELVQRAQRGESDAFADLFHAHKARIYSICLRMTNNTAKPKTSPRMPFCRCSENCPPLRETRRCPPGSIASRSIRC